MSPTEVWYKYQSTQLTSSLATVFFTVTLTETFLPLSSVPLTVKVPGFS